jgi:hypothetical protein
VSWADHKIVQLARDILEVVGAYVGDAGELTVDTNNWNLHLSDGTTPGGRVFLNVDNTDTRYQARSTELDGLLQFKDQDRGFLARLGPGSYRLRTFTFDSNSFTLTNPDGYGGNPLLGLADDITRDLTFSGVLTTTQQIVGTGGFKGDVQGNVVGNITGNVTGNLTGDSTGAHSGPQTGDVDVRGHTLQLDAGQIHLAALNDDVLTYIFNRAVPVGFIGMWSGTVDAIPENWALCDGGSGTPDLRNRFVVGATDVYAQGSTGGNLTLTPNVTIANGGAHTHDGTAADHALTLEEIPPHLHGGGIGCGPATDQQVILHGSDPAVSTATFQSNNKGGVSEPRTTTVGGFAGVVQGHSHDVTIDSGGDHTHDLTIVAGSILPPYYALAYIQKVA